MNKNKNSDIFETIKTVISSIKQSNDYNAIEKMLEEIQDSDIDAETQLLLYSIYEINTETENDYLWSLLHFIEKIPNSESSLIKSLNKLNSVFTVRMLGRCLNANINNIDGIDVRKYLTLIIEDAYVS